MEKITALVVTYNRLNLLKNAISAIKRQTRKLDNIIVVNNGSTDGTKEWLEQQDGLDVVNQDNVGGSGGFYTGIKYAHEKGYDWVWCMDDDVYPSDNCLESLLKFNNSNVGILCPKRLVNGKPCLSEYKVLDLENGLKPLHQQRITMDDVTTKDCFPIMAMAFEGPLIKREVIDKIGYPNKNLFIYYDDTDYSYRTVLAGKQVLYVSQAILFKEDLVSGIDPVVLRQRGKWKLVYEIRNYAYFNHHYGKNIVVKYYRSYAQIIHFTFVFLANIANEKYNSNDLKKWYKAMFQGFKEILGKI